MEPFSLVFIPAVSSVSSLKVSWRLVPFPASLSISWARASARPLMDSDIFVFHRLYAECLGDKRV